MNAHPKNIRDPGDCKKPPSQLKNGMDGITKRQQIFLWASIVVEG